MTRSGFWPVVTVTTLNALLGTIMLLWLVPAVVGLYQRGYGDFSAVIYFVLVPAISLLLSTLVPIWLRWRRNNVIAAIGVGVLSILAWLGYFLALGPLAAI
jgi:hypothetical protein